MPTLPPSYPDLRGSNLGVEDAIIKQMDVSVQGESVDFDNCRWCSICSPASEALEVRCVLNEARMASSNAAALPPVCAHLKHKLVGKQNDREVYSEASGMLITRPCHTIIILTVR